MSQGLNLGSTSYRLVLIEQSPALTPKIKRARQRCVVPELIVANLDTFAVPPGVLQRVSETLWKQSPLRSTDNTHLAYFGQNARQAAQSRPSQAGSQKQERHRKYSKFSK